MAATDKEKKYPDWWYQSPYQKELDSLAGQIENRPEFKFKVDHEALYNYYKGEYDRQGREAKLDTEAKGAALTGGYGNSYARQAGQQAYDGQMEGLQENVAPDLWQMALDKYTREGEALVDRYTALQKKEKAAYEQWQEDYVDEIEAWEKEQESDATEKKEWKPWEDVLTEEERTVATEKWIADVAQSYENGFLTEEEWNDFVSAWNIAGKEPEEQPDAEGEAVNALLENNGYSVTNYPQAVSRLRNMGVFDHVVQNLLSEKDFDDVQKENRRVLETGDGTYNVIVGQYSTYAEYLRGYLTMAEQAMANKRPGYTGNYVTGTGGRYGTTGGAM